MSSNGDVPVAVFAPHRLCSNNKHVLHYSVRKDRYKQRTAGVPGTLWASFLKNISGTKNTEEEEHGDEALAHCYTDMLRAVTQTTE